MGLLEFYIIPRFVPGVSFPRSISDLLTVVYSAIASVVTNVKSRHRRTRLSTIDVHVDEICALAWIRRYADSRSVFPVRMLLNGHLIRMDAIMWSILRRQNP